MKLLVFEIINGIHMCLGIRWDWLVSAVYQKLSVDITSIITILIMKDVYKRAFLSACSS